MKPPENHTLHLLRELRSAIAALDSKLDDKVDSLDKKINRNHEELKERIDSIRQAMLGESVLGRYATAEFEERLAALENRISTLEKRG
jgi:polyhydroxyalkanoate synthesis regulator phasin